MRYDHTSSYISNSEFELESVCCLWTYELEVRRSHCVSSNPKLNLNDHTSPYPNLNLIWWPWIHIVHDDAILRRLYGRLQGFDVSIRKS